jgi:hypothetical protein
VSEEDASTSLRLVVFLLPLPEPLPLPHMETYSFVGEEHPALENAALVPVENIDAVPEALVGRLGVSIRAWQHKIDALAPMKEEIERVAHVVEAMLGSDEYRQLRERGAEEANVQDDSLIAHHSPDLERPEELEQSDEEYSTILEAVTPLIDRGLQDPISDAFDLCVDAAAKLVRAFRIASKLPVAPLTRERLPSVIHFLTRNARGEQREWNQGVMMTRLVEAEMILEPANEEQLAHFNRHLLAVEAQHPLVPYTERRIDATFALERMGDTANAVILAELSGVIFLDVVLTQLLWDEGATAAATAEVLDRPFKARFKNEYSPRLGGDWNLSNGDGSVGRWYRDVYLLRNRVLHGGHIPDRQAARDAHAAADGLVTFLLDRIADRRYNYPRTALLTFDTRDRRGVLSARMKRLSAELEADRPLVAQFVDWQEAVDAVRQAP